MIIRPRQFSSLLTLDVHYYCWQWRALLWGARHARTLMWGVLAVHDCWLLFFNVHFLHLPCSTRLASSSLDQWPTPLITTTQDYHSTSDFGENHNSPSWAQSLKANVPCLNFHQTSTAWPNDAILKGPPSLQIPPEISSIHRSMLLQPWAMLLTLTWHIMCLSQKKTYLDNQRQAVSDIPFPATPPFRNFPFFYQCREWSIFNHGRRPCRLNAYQHVRPKTW